MHFRGYFGKAQVETVTKNFVPLASAGGNNGWFETATGKKLSVGIPNYAKALDEFQKLPEAERKPRALEPGALDLFQDAFPVPEGGLAVRTYLRYVAPDAKGELQPAHQVCAAEEKRGPGYAAQQSGPNRDFLYLTEAEWKALAPRGAKGERRTVPEAVAKRIFVCHLYDGVTGCGPFWSREHLKAGELTLTVDEGGRMRLEGSAKQFAGEAHKADWKILGYLHFDARKGAFDRFDFVALGESVHNGKHLVGIAGELAPAGSLGVGSTPYWCRNDPQGKVYFGMKE